MSDYTDIIDYYTLLAMQNPGKAVYHPPAEPLSPAAKAVLNAVTLKRWDVPYQACGQSLEQIQDDVAAALRAAADQSENLYDPHEGKVSVVRVEHLIAIADELEAQ